MENVADLIDLITSDINGSSLGDDLFPPMVDSTKIYFTVNPSPWNSTNNSTSVSFTYDATTASFKSVSLDGSGSISSNSSISEIGGIGYVTISINSISRAGLVLYFYPKDDYVNFSPSISKLTLNGVSTSAYTILGPDSTSETIDNYNPDGIYQFFNELTGTDFYTGNQAEVGNVLATLPSFNFEGLAFEENVSGSTDSVDVFRFYNTTTKTHFYTASQTEADNIKANLPSFTYEGIAYEAHSTNSVGTTELYRFYNSQTGTHFYTADHAEMENVKVELAGIMNFEGVAYYVDI